jgi:3-hydroxymyristoyl/3-hydroxydecanoyl-(acyl carrier protein) dehydratase
MPAASRSLSQALTVEPGHPALPGHFPGLPLVPGVLLLERVLEAAEALLGREPEVLELVSAKFIAPLGPGEAAEIAIELDGSRLRFRIATDARTLAQGEFRLAGSSP